MRKFVTAMRILPEIITTLLIWIVWTLIPANKGVKFAFATKHRKLIRAIVIFVLVAVYLNVGWAIGTYYHNYIFGHTPQTFWQTVWKGGYPAIPNTVYDSPLYDQILSMFAWPLLGLISVLLWVVRFAQIGTIYFIWLVSWLVSYIFKLIFAGGIAKLLGVG